MTDHYRKSLELLDEVDDLATELRAAYGYVPANPKVVADIHGKMSRTLKKADIHATLSVAQALHDLEAARHALAGGRS